MTVGARFVLLVGLLYSSNRVLGYLERLNQVGRIEMKNREDSRGKTIGVKSGTGGPCSI